MTSDTYLSEVASYVHSDVVRDDYRDVVRDDYRHDFRYDFELGRHGHHTAGCRVCGARLWLSSVEDVVDSMAAGVICWSCDVTTGATGHAR